MIKYYLLSVLAAILTAIGQVLLKKYALRSPRSFFKKITNIYLITSITSFVVTTALSIYIMQSLDFTVYYALTALNFVFITYFSVLYLNEKADKHKLLGLSVIVLGLIIFNL